MTKRPHPLAVGIVIAVGVTMTAGIGSARLARGATAPPAGAAQTSDQKRTVRTGVYTIDQARRGKATYRRCILCHLEAGQGDPAKGAGPIAGEQFLKTWSTHTLKELFELMKANMPQDNPGSLTPKQCADVLSYVLQLNKFPAGDQELPTDAVLLDRIIIEQP